MKLTNTMRHGDAVAVATILSAGIVIGWPILTGGYLTYLDNPAHLAELNALGEEARSGWSEIAFCGFPIHTLHSPMWYGLLSLLSRSGLPAGPLYVFFVWLGFVAPALAVYKVARRTLEPLSSGGVAYLLLVQRPVIVGVGSAWGGMWTFYLAAAAFVLLADVLSRRDTSPRGAALIAALTGFILLTHLYALVPLAALATAHVLVSTGKRRFVIRHAVAGAVGLLAASAYWMPVLLARGALNIHPQNLDARMILLRLVAPTHVLQLVNGRIPEPGLRLVVESLPMVLLVLAGGWGLFCLSRRRNDTPVYGAVVGAVLLAVLLFVTGEFDARFLGPGSWRMLYFVRIGLALSVIPLVGCKTGRFIAEKTRFTRTAGLAAATAAVALGWWFGSPLRAQTEPPDGAEMSEVRLLWDWLETNRSPAWGRVYLQDTFDLPDPDIKLSHSHVLALTAHETGVRQLGATYGVAPYRTIDWTPSEFGTLFRQYIRDDLRIRRALEWMWAANTTHVVVSDPRTRQMLETSPEFDPIHRVGRFTVFAVPGVTSEWASSLEPGLVVGVDSFETGRYRLSVQSPGGRIRVFVKSSWHPAWSLEGPPGISLRLEQEPSGLMRIDGAGAGEFNLLLEYRPPRWPLWLSLLGWIAIAVASKRARIEKA